MARPLGHSQQPEDPRFCGLARDDRERGTFLAYREGPNRWWSEAPFTPRDGWCAEDDGYLVNFVWDGDAQRSRMYAFDAKDLSRGPLCRVTLPQRLPSAFHATWVVGAERLARGW